MCPNCRKQTKFVCRYHGVCFNCHDDAINDLREEVMYATQRYPNTESEDEGFTTRTLGSRIVGSMWNPGDPSEKDDIPALVRRINRLIRNTDTGGK